MYTHMVAVLCTGVRLAAQHVRTYIPTFYVCSYVLYLRTYVHTYVLLCIVTIQHKLYMRMTYVHTYMCKCVHTYIHTYVNSGTAIADTFLPPLLSLWKMNCLTSISLFPLSTPSFLFATPSFLFAIPSLLSVTISCREDNPYCESCYSRTFGVTCASCNKLITGRGLQVASMLSLCTHRMYVHTYIHT